MFNNTYKTHLVFLVLLFLGGCASNAYIQKVKAPNKNLTSYNHVLIKTSAPAKTKAKKGYDPSIVALENDFITSLSGFNKFDSVNRQTANTNKDNALIINLVMEDFSYLSGAASVAGGVMTGNAYVKVFAQMVDAESGQIIGEIRSGAHTDSMDGIFRGSTGTLIIAAGG